MALITLTTDFGNKDHFIGSVKGVIYSEIPEAKIVEISNEISPFNIAEGAYIIENAYKNFPKGSIHILGVDSEKTPEKKHLVIILDDHYFICADNGIMSLVAKRIKPKK
jgi:S-adenosylmethionine hydrolase